MRVEPPTRTTSSISRFCNLASRNACSTGPSVLRKKSYENKKKTYYANDSIGIHLPYLILRIVLD